MPFYFRIRQLGILVILLGAIAACSAPRTSTDVSQSATARLVEHASFVHRAGAQHEHIWTDFWNHQQGFILYFRQGPALLYTHSTPLPGGTEVAPHTYIYPNGLDRLTDSIYLRYPLPDTTVTAVALQSRGEQTAGLLFHEAFHSWQSTHFKQRMDVRFVSDDIFADAHLRALLQIRREILSNALSQQAVSVADLSALHSIEQELRESLGDDALERLYQLELIEGSAELVGMRAQILSLPSYSRQIDLRASMIMSLKERLAHPSGSIQSASALRLYAYGTGAASSFLLAQLDSDYQHTLTNDLLDQPILSSVIAKTEPPALAKVYADLRYAHWLRWANDDEQTEGNLTLSDFAALTPATLDIAINMRSAAGAADLNINFSTGERGFSQPQAGSYMLPDPVSVSVHGANTSLLITGAATHLISPKDNAAVLRLQIKVDSLPALCAFNPDGSRVLNCELDSLSLNWEGVQFEHQAKTMVRQRGQFLHIDVNEH